MSLLVVTLAGLAIAEWTRPWLGDRAWWLAAASVLFVWVPGPALMAGVAAGFMWWRRRLASRRRRSEAAEGEVLLLAELVALGLAAGLPFGSALSMAAEELVSGLASEVQGVLRAARRKGMETSLSESTGAAAEFFQLSARAVTTGSPLGPAIESFVRQRRSEEKARRLSQARRLPVRLMLPLALLILPGFVLLTLGPALVGAVDKVGLALPPVVGRPPI